MASSFVRASQPIGFRKLTSRSSCSCTDFHRHTSCGIGLPKRLRMTIDCYCPICEAMAILRTSLACPITATTASARWPKMWWACWTSSMSTISMCVAMIGVDVWRTDWRSIFQRVFSSCAFWTLHPRLTCTTEPIWILPGPTIIGSISFNPAPCPRK